MRQCREPYRRLADCFDAVVGKQESCLDIGCGIGLQTARLKDLGWGAVGAEHSPYAIEMIEPGVTVLPFDLTLPNHTLGEPFSCVVCTETGEHIPAEHAMAVARNVASSATNFIIWSAAAPGQEWEGHINLQHPEYWLTRFRMLGWDLDDDRTAKLRYLMSKTNAQHVLGKENFCVLVPTGRPLHMTIVSTILNGEKWIEKHVESVRRQTFQSFTHVVIDAASNDGTNDIVRELLRGTDGQLILKTNDPRKAALENLWETIHDLRLPDDEVIVWLDGDDWLAHDQALEIVARVYCSDKEPWLTFGQFMFQDGGMGFASPYAPGAHARLDPVWRATHLKTFRAGLVKKLNVEDIKHPDSSWVDLAIDRAIMWPLLEMAGDHYACIPQIVSVYNYDASWAANRPADQLKIELDEVARLRGLTPYPALSKRPW
jgi:SAM-dependent methyltransferase